MENSLEKDFDLEKLKIDQSFLDLAGGKTVQLTVPIRKPKKQLYFRAHADQKYSLTVYFLEREGEMNETYILSPNLPEAAEEAKPVTLVGCITNNGTFFFWPLALPDADGKLLECHRSAHVAANIAKSQWIRMFWDKELRSYKIKYPEETFPDPAWPEQSAEELFEIAFKNKIISDRNHPVLKQLRGAK